jgi:hypothetical protein
MKRAADLVLFLLLALGLAVAVAGGFVGTTRVYSLAEVQQGRQSNQAAWVGRTVLVRGQLVGVSTGMQSFEEISAPFTWRQRLGFGGLPRRYNVYRPPAPLVRPLIVVRGPGVTGRTPVTPSTLVAAGMEMASRLRGRVYPRRASGARHYVSRAPLTATPLRRMANAAVPRRGIAPGGAVTGHCTLAMLQATGCRARRVRVGCCPDRGTPGCTS